MKFKMPQMLAATALTIGLAATGVGAVHAATTANKTNPMSNLVNAIASKFNLNSADVQQVFDQQHLQMQAERQQQFKDRLAEQVTAGNLTQDQANKIIAKMQEIETQHQTNMQSMQTMTAEQRQAVMEKERTALEQWATDNNIPKQYLRFGMGKGHGGHDKKSGNFLDKTESIK